MSPKVKKIQRSAALVLCALLALLLAGCRVQITVSSLDSLVGEEYPDARRYQVGPLTYDAAQVKAVEVYWRSGQVELAESEGATLSARESGAALSADASMRKGDLYVFGPGESHITVETASGNLFIQ